MDEAEVDQPQPLVAHLTELRDKLLRAILAVLIVFIGLFPFANEIYAFVSEPLRAILPEGATMIATEVASPFLTPFKLTLVAAIFLAIPYVLYQVWSFIAPGMYRHEKRLAIPLLVSSILLFYCGAAFAYYVVFPLIFAFFTSVGPTDVTIMTDINSYLDFVLKLFFRLWHRLRNTHRRCAADLGRHYHTRGPGQKEALYHRRLFCFRHVADATGYYLPGAAGDPDVDTIRIWGFLREVCPAQRT